MVSDTKICTRCVMDTTVPDIVFDGDGICNYCHVADILLSRVRLSMDESETKLNLVAENIIKKGQGKKYDSIIGLSGGVDSSYVAYLATQLGLRPLAVHFDNGWNSEIAVTNIKNIVGKLGLDLITYVINWEEFRDLQCAFIKASVVDIEMLTDHAQRAATLKIAKKQNIGFSIVGNNVATEHGMPRPWIWDKEDLRNIKAIHKRYGEKRMKNFPHLSSLRSKVISYFKLGYERVPILNYINYRKLDAMKVLKEEFGWRYYGGKHYESVFTKFYQAYILPEKFGIDKRKVHLSALIRNEEIGREEALTELAKPLYDPVELKAEKEFILKKLGFTEEEFNFILKKPQQSHDSFPSDEKVMQFLYAIGVRLKKIGILRGFLFTKRG